MTRPMFEASDKIIEGTFSEPIDIEAVCRAINEDLECLKNAEITNGDGSLKLRNGKLIFLEIERKDLKNIKSVAGVVTDKVLDVYGERVDEGEMVLGVAIDKYKEYYLDVLSGDGSKSRLKANEVRGPIKKNVEPQVENEVDLFKGSNGLMPNPGVESVVLAGARSFMVFNERGRKMMEDISAEKIEIAYLAAISENDEARTIGLSKQAANALKSLDGMGIRDEWKNFYTNTMNIKFGVGNYPVMASAQGLQLFFTEVYDPIVRDILSRTQIVSVMGDHAATKITAELEAEIEMLLANKRAEVAEIVQPAQRRVDDEVMKTRANEASLYVENEDKLKRAKEITNRLALKTVTAPVTAAATELIEAGAEAGPVFFKGFAEILRRWQDQVGGDRKLVAVTSGGIAVGLVVSPLAAILMGNVWLLSGIGIIPCASAAGYMAVRGFIENGEMGEGKR